MAFETIIEPFRIHSIEPLRMTTVAAVSAVGPGRILDVDSPVGSWWRCLGLLALEFLNDPFGVVEIVDAGDFDKVSFSAKHSIQVPVGAAFSRCARHRFTAIGRAHLGA